MNRLLCGVMMLVPLLATTRQTEADFTFITFDVPGSVETHARGISTAGLVGEYRDASDRSHGFLLTDGQYITLDVPGATNTGATGINDSGEIVGSYQAASLNAFRKFIV